MRSSRTLCYTVAWLEGKAERFQSEVCPNMSKAMDLYKQVERFAETALVIRGDELILPTTTD